MSASKRFVIRMFHDGEGIVAEVGSFDTKDQAHDGYKALEAKWCAEEDANPDAPPPFEGCDAELLDTETGELYWWDYDDGGWEKAD